jgi:predicted AAA+ superfamily ATPase
MLQRTLKSALVERFHKGKVLVLVGPRQVGKTTLIKEILKDTPYLFLDGDDPVVRNQLTNAGKMELEAIMGKAETVFVDEAQRIENIGITLKIIHDQFKSIQLIVSGSSSLELRSEMNEPLTGRKWEYRLLPISYEEYENSLGYLAAQGDLENRLIHGFYPDVINHKGMEREVLNELTESYLFKDILAYGNIRKPEVLEKILRALAFQVGNEVSYNEIAQLVGIDKNTVSTYIQLLEMSFVVYSLTSFSRNLRNEIKTNRKIYFYDNGVRNALIQNFNPLALRNDVGALWENFLMAERMKRNEYHRYYANTYFWRTVQQQEVDYVEERDGVIKGFEFKWNAKAKVSKPKSFIETYDATIEVITKENFRDFVLADKIK